MPRALPTDVDVAVLGGGPAGATAARLLARWGFDVVLLTRPAARPTLAESLPPSGVALLEKLGVRDAVDAAGFLRATGNTVRWGAGEQRVERFGGRTFGYQVSRDMFDRALLAEAKASGAHVRTRAHVRSVARDRGPEARAVVAWDEGTTRQLRARWVLDCTGRVRLTARRDARYVEPGWRTTALVGVWERTTPWPLADETHTVVESDRRGWAWSIPVTRERRYVVVMVNPDLTDIGSRRELEWTYLRELCEFEGVRRLVTGARRNGRVFARDASPYVAERVVRDGVLLVGDAASFVDPLSSYGVKKALASAWLGAVVARSVFENPSVQDAAVELFERREHAMYDALRLRTTALARMARTSEHDFWTARVEADDVTSIDEPDIAALRTDRDVRRALEELKRRETLSLRMAARVHRVPKATVRGQRVVLEDHLVAREFPEGVRWIRSVDLVTLADLASAHHQVPDLYDAYNRAAPPVPLPDFLGALSVLVGKRLLTFA